MVLGKKVALFYWEWGQDSAPREGRKCPGNSSTLCCVYLTLSCWVIFHGFIVYDIFQNKLFQKILSRTL